MTRQRSSVTSRMSRCEPSAYNPTKPTPPYLTLNSTIRNQQQSPLLRLPAELRTRIYQEIITKQEIELFPKVGGPRNYVAMYRVDEIWKRTKEMKFESLPRVSGQLHHETSLLSIAVIEFHLGVHSVTTSFRDFRKRFTTAQEGAIRTVHLWVATQHFVLANEHVVGVKEELATALSELHGLCGLRQLVLVGGWFSLNEETEANGMLEAASNHFHQDGLHSYVKIDFVVDPW